jgi:hypothetical protein
MSSVHWLKTNNVYRKVEGDFKTVDTVPAGIYNLGVSMTGWYLEKYADKFTFDYKMYGLQTEFCNHVLKTYHSTNGNFGIMLTGTKGTGKTVTAKTLANDFNLPVIIVKDMGDSNQSMIEYLSGFNFDCVLFLDEFEKNFSDKDSTILQIMDGVYNIGYRKIFLLTTNALTVNENLLGRPSRIRYVKRFGNLELKTVEEYLDDELKVPEARQELIDFIDTLTISTIDILKTIVNEVNIHGIDGLMKAKEFFNVTTLDFNYSCVREYVEEEEMMGDPDRYNMKNFLRDVNKFENPIWEPGFYRNTPKEQWTDSQKKEYDEWQENRRKVFNGTSHTTCHTNCRFQHLKVGGEFDGEEIVILDIKKGVVVTKYDGYFYWYCVLNPNKKPSLYGDASADFARYLDY